MVNAVELSGVGRSFGALRAVKSINLSIPPGQRHVVLGPNGAGKTTLFNLICGDFPPTSGNVNIFGVDVTRQTPHKRARIGVGRTYQTSLLFNQLTVEENLFVAIRGARPGRFSFRLPRAGAAELRQVRALADRVRLTPMLERTVTELSHGQRRQLEVGMALACDPRLLMLDEPAAGLSPGERPELNALLRDLPRDLTLILIEHDMDVALPIADVVTVMKDGEIVVQAPPDRIADDPVVKEIYLGRAHD